MAPPSGRGTRRPKQAESPARRGWDAKFRSNLLGFGRMADLAQYRDCDHRPRAFYHRFAWAYDLIVGHPGGPHVAAVVDAFARGGLERGAVMVDAGCGTGAYACGLAARGFKVIAVDKSTELAAEARARAQRDELDVEFVCADFTAGWAPAHRVDGVLCRGVLNDLLSDDERTRAFEAFGSWLRPSGVLLVDVRDRASSGRRYSGGRRLERAVRRGDDVLTFVSRTTMDPGSDLLQVVEHWSGTVGGTAVDEENRFTMRCWTWEGLQQVAQAAGFGLVAALAADTLGARDDRLVALAHR
jgi:SAM-dependent methyltransferase